VTLLALDGAITRGICEQSRQIPAGATHLFLSVGGNDALAIRSVLFGGSAMLIDALESLADIQATFRANYRAALKTLKARALPTFICTIYDAIPGLSAGERAGLSLFNDVIVREALERRFGLIDLRSLCCDASDYSAVSPIEPSYAGGRKIATAIAERVGAVTP
jgi:hypothetical protein